ncbi:MULTISPECIES: O-antigen ligase family protein [unclassified Methylobacterium]|uniref:O-antigen ligase family protein n=1 Tax=unclassified Methylobacterium TaxID=2615210 RepID=UPI00226A08A8|nr:MULTISPECIES: O-antigen ligase family protein [unclassified Methylobacterium]
MTAPSDARGGRRADLLAGAGIAVPAALALVAALASPVLGEAAYAMPVLALVAAAAAIVLLGALRGRPWAIGAILAFTIVGLNINFRLREIGDVGLDWQNGTKLATWLAVVGVAAARYRTLAVLLRDPAVACVAVYGILALASAAWSPTPAYTGANAFGLVAALCLAALIAVDLGTVRALRVSVASLCALMLISLAGGVAVPDIAFTPPSDVETVYRLQGFSGHPNVLGQQAVILCLLAVAAWRLRAVGPAAFLAALALGLATVMASRSRFALTAFLVGWAFVVLRRRLPLAAAIAIPALAAATLVAGIAAVVPLPDPDALFGELSRTGSANEITTLTGRTDLWAAAAGRIAERPLFGWGFNGTEGMLLDALPKTFVGSAVNAHNMIVQTLLSLGFVGSIPAFGFLGILVAKAVSAPEPLRDNITVFVLVNGMGEVEIFGTPVLLTLLAYWAIARHAAEASRPAGPNAEGVAR